MSILKKYPELDALSIFISPEKGNFKQRESFPKKVDAEIIFVSGIFELKADFTDFLELNPEIEVVFIVDTLSQLLYFTKQKQDDHFDHERVHVLWKEDGIDLDSFAEAIASRFPNENAIFLQADETLKKALLRKLVLEVAIHKELISYPMLCKNLFRNVYRLSGSFNIGLWKDAFKGTPAIIAGAGPSLSSQKENFENLKDKALLFAGGSTITALDKMGIAPHLAFAIDPNLEEYERLRYSHVSCVPLLYGNRVQKDVFRFFSGSTGYIRTDTGGLFEAYADDKLKVQAHGILSGLSEEAMSVTTIALMTAVHLGCSPIYFAGVDLSFKKGKRYSGGILSNWESSIKKDPTQVVKWMMEKDVIDEVAETHTEIQFYDATGDGTTFKNIPAKKLEEEHFLLRSSLDGKIENLIIDSKYDVSSGEIRELFDEIEGALEKLIVDTTSYLKGEIPYSLFGFIVEENKAYELFFKGMVYALQQPLAKKLKKEGKDQSDEGLARTVFAKVLKEAKDLSSLIINMV